MPNPKPREMEFKKFLLRQPAKDKAFAEISAVEKKKGRRLTHDEQAAILNRHGFRSGGGGKKKKDIRGKKGIR